MASNKFDRDLLKTVVGTLNAKSPTLAKKLAISVARSGLESETIGELTQPERKQLAEAIDIFQEKILQSFFKKVPSRPP